MKHDFSVVIPTFRRPQQLGEAISSVIGQAGVSVQIIVVDDSPEGSALELVNRLNDSRILYLQNPEPTGGVPSVVRNLGWPHAAGTFVHFLDDDDIVPAGYYTAVKSAFATHPEVGLVFGRVEPFGVGPESQLQHERAYFADAARKAAGCRAFGPKWAFVGRMLFDKALLVCSASVVRRECVHKLGGFDPTIRLMEDADFHVRVMREFGAFYLDRVAVRYRIGAASLMHAPNPDQRQRDSERAGHRQMQTKYRKSRGAVEFYGLAVFTRTMLRIV